MNCSEFETTVVDIARRRPVDAELRRLVEAHTAGCDSCRGLLEREELVTEDLAALRTAMREVSAPAGLEGTLVAAFRARPAAVAGAPARRPTAFPRWWLGAAAALALTVGSAVAGWWLATDRTGDAAIAPTRVDSAPSTLTRVPPVAQATEAPAPPDVGVVRARPAPAKTRRRAQMESPEVSSGQRVTYTSLPAALPRWSDEPLVPVRLQLPYAALPALGVQITREQWGETVPVEVLVGEDGIARGIRLVRNEVMDR